MFDILREAAD